MTCWCGRRSRGLATRICTCHLTQPTRTRPRPEQPQHAHGALVRRAKGAPSSAGRHGAQTHTTSPLTKCCVAADATLTAASDVATHARADTHARNHHALSTTTVTSEQGQRQKHASRNQMEPNPQPTAILPVPVDTRLAGAAAHAAPHSCIKAARRRRVRVLRGTERQNTAAAGSNEWLLHKRQGTHTHPDTHSSSRPNSAPHTVMAVVAAADIAGCSRAQAGRLEQTRPFRRRAQLCNKVVPCTSKATTRDQVPASAAALARACVSLPAALRCGGPCGAGLDTQWGDDQ